MFYLQEEAHRSTLKVYWHPVRLYLLHELVTWTHCEIDLLTQCALEVPLGSADGYKIVPAEIRKKERDIDITVWACSAFGIGAEEVGGRDRRISLNDR